MSTKFALELAALTEEVTSSKIVELTDREIETVAGGLLVRSKEQIR